MLYETLKELFTGICDAVRAKEGTVGLIDHQDIPARITELKSAPGGTAGSGDIREGKSAWVDGELVDGGLPVVRSSVAAFSGDDVSISKGTSNFLFSAMAAKEQIYPADVTVRFEVPLSRFGDAEADNVDYGVTFTSKNGLLMTGKRPVDEGSGTVVAGGAEADSLAELHYWEKRAAADTITEEKVEDYELYYYNSSLSITSYGFTHYASEIEVVDGALALVDPIDRGTINEETLNGKYIQNGSSFYRIPADAAITTTRNAGATAYTKKNVDRAFKLTCVTSGSTSIIVSNDSSAYPENGEQDGYSYVYKGTLSEAGAAAVIQALTITANGTYTVPDGVDGYSPITVNVPSEGGVQLPTLTTPAAATDLALDKQLIGADGEIVTGTLAEATDGIKIMSQFAELIGDPGATTFNVTATYLPNDIGDNTKGVILRPGALQTPRNIPTNLFGDAAASDVAKGKTFTSAAGLLVEGTMEAASADLSDIGNLHFWEKHGGDPSNAYLEQENVTANLKVAVTSVTGATSTNPIYHGSTFTFDAESKQFSLESDGYCTSLSDAQTKLPGKYIRYYTDKDYLYYVPEDAEISEYTTSYVGTTRYIKITNATKLTVNELLGYVASEGSDTYPENGEHSDGYWYVYRGLLADALGQ